MLRVELEAVDISIHAPLTWRDRRNASHRPYQSHFNPRATYVARLSLSAQNADSIPFQSTRHLRGATCGCCRWRSGISISIHAPLTWRDARCWASPRRRRNFNPRATYVARRWQRPRTPPSRANFNPRATYVARLQFCTITVHNYIFKLVESSNFSFHLS